MVEYSAPEPPTHSVKLGPASGAPVVVPVELAPPEVDAEPLLPPVDVPELLPPVDPGPALESPPPPLEVAAAEVPVVAPVDDAKATPVAEPKEGE